MSQDRWRRLRIVALVVAAVLPLLVIRLHLDPAGALDPLRTWVDGQGLVGMIGFGATYVVLVLMLVPGAILTLTAGALFGPLAGVTVVAVATSVADAIAFLVARHLARDAVLALQRRYPHFLALERALATGGWRVVALLRLNPAIPYSASNYLFGVTAVPFIPYLVASGVFTLPGAFAYSYLGYVGAETISGETRSVLEWGGLWIGLAAAVGTVAYLTVLARRALAAVDAGETVTP